MSVIIDFTWQNVEGQGIPGAAVELWTGDGGAGQSKVADFSDLGQGNYKAIYDSSGIYTIKVNGTAVPHMTGRYLSADDELLQGHVDGVTLEYVDIGGGVYKLRIKAGGVGASQLGAVTGDGAAKDGDGKIIPDVDDVTLQVNPTSKKIEIKANKSHTHAAAEVTIADAGGYTLKTQVEDALQEIYGKIGSLDLSGIELLKDSSIDDVTKALKALNSQITANRKAIFNGTDIYNRRTIYSDFITTKTEAGAIDQGDMPEYSNNTVTAEEQIIHAFFKRTGDVNLNLNCEAKLGVAGKPGEATIYIVDDAYSTSKEIGSTYNLAYKDFSLTHNITNIPDNTLVLYIIYLKSKTAGDTSYLRYVNIDVTGV